MRVLVTGHRGFVGRAVVDALTATGAECVGLDLVEGDDVLGPLRVSERATGCTAVVHLAAVEDEADDYPVPSKAATAPVNRVRETNVGGTRNVLSAAEEHGFTRVVYLSSVDVLGCFLGMGQPVYFPIDDDHPTNPVGEYAQAKLQSEDLCAEFTHRTGIPTVCLRPPGVCDDDVYAFIRRARMDDPEFEWRPFWEFGAFIDIRDLATAVACALTADLVGHHRLLTCASDISSARDDSLSLARRLMPGVPVREPAQFVQEPFKALVDSHRAQRILGWRPSYTWRN
ncbi:MAG: NAD-dependent epimerase/dehydratase family protein [Actinomycetes bacterium]